LAGSSQKAVAPPLNFGLSENFCQKSIGKKGIFTFHI